MFFKLLNLEIKAFFRSAGVGKGIGIKIFLFLLGLYFLASYLFLGITLYPLSLEFYPDQEPIYVINNYLLRWFCFEFVLRFIFQNLPILKVKPLLTQRIKRSSIINVLLIKSLFSYYNILTLAIAVPFVITNITSSSFTLFPLLMWLFAVIVIVLSLNYLNFLIQRKFSSNAKVLIPFIAICLILVAIEYFNIFSISELFGSYFYQVLAYPLLGLIPIGLLIVSYLLSYRDVDENFYLDAYLENKQKTYQSSDLSWTNRFGALAPFLQLDLKLLWRNKRTRNTLYVSLGFLAYGLIFYPNPMYQGSSMLIFVGIFITGVFMINFGQFVPAWDSSYFAFLQTRPTTMKNYLEAKALLMYASILILSILSSFYVLFGWEILFINFSCAIYNAGINIPIILAFSAYNRKYIDLSNSSMFNYQGVGAAQWLISLPLIIPPIIIWMVLKTFIDLTTANIVLISLGVIGLLLRKVFINGIVELYLNNRFKMLNGFKQKDN